MGKVFLGSPRKEDYIKEAMKLWDCYGSSYRTFKGMIMDQRNGKKQPYRIPNVAIVEFPTIDFLSMETPEEARRYLEVLEIASIRYIIRTVERLSDNYGYRFMRERSISYRFVDNRHPSCPFGRTFGMDPDYVMSGAARRKRHFNNAD